MFLTKSLTTATILAAIAIAGIGLGAAALPLKAQNQEMLCQFYFPGCTVNECQTTYCDVYYPESFAYCQGSQGQCCNCYY